MALIATINTAEIRDLGFVFESTWSSLERQYEDAVGNRQCAALIEGITEAEDDNWTDMEKPGRAITVDAENMADLEAGVAWVRDNYRVFTVHIETDDLHAPLSDGDLDEVQRSMDEAGGRPAKPEEGCTRCSCGAKYWDEVRAYSARNTTSRSYWVCHSCGERWDGLDHTNDAPPRSSYDVEVAAQVRAAVGTAQDAAVNRFPNDAGAALRYLSALLAGAAEEV